MLAKNFVFLPHVGGTRGGQDQFKWEDVKNDRDRENYLGHSVLAPVGRWQKGRDLTWYAKSKTDQDATLEEERRKLRALDEDLLNDALGIRAKRKWNETESLDQDEMRRLLSRGEIDRDEGEQVQRIKGLGAAPSKGHDHVEKKSRIELELEKYRNPGNSEQTNQASSGRIIPLLEKPVDSQRSSSPPRNSKRNHSDDSSRDSDDSRRHRKKEKKEKHKKDKKDKKHKHKSDRDRH